MTAQIQPRQCKTCRWFECLYNEAADVNIPMCRLHGRKDPTPCDDFEREPGADDE